MRLSVLRTEGEVNKLLLKPEEAAEVMSSGRTKVYELMAQGLLVSVRIGGSRRVPLEAVTEFIHGLPHQSAVVRRSPIAADNDRPEPRKSGSVRVNDTERQPRAMTKEPSGGKRRPGSSRNASGRTRSGRTESLGAPVKADSQQALWDPANDVIRPLER
jgi:excisionase family DNA binding protein